VTSDTVGPQTEFKGVELLLVTADPALIDCYRRGLPAASFSLWDAPTLEAAQPLLRRQEFAAVLLDCANSSHLTPPVLLELPLIALIQPNQEDEANAILAAGFHDYLIRNEVDPRLLKRSLRYARERHAAGQDHLPGRDQLEQKWVAEEASESELRFRAFFETTPVGFVVGDSFGRPLSSNPAMQQMLGYDEAEMKNLDPNQVTYPADIAKDSSLFRELLEGKRTSYRLEKRYIAKDGRLFWGDLSVTVVRDAQGQPTYFFAMVVDITEYKKTEAALREGEHLYRTLIEQSNDAIYLLYNNKFELINKRFSEMFGVTADEVRASSFDFMELVAPPSIAYVRERVRQAGNGQPLSPRYEFMGRNRSGDVIYLEASVSYIPYQGGTAVQGILRDVSERKRSEAVLQASEKRFRALIENSSDAVALLTVDGTVLYTTPATERLLGYTADEFIGQNALSLVHPDDLDNTLQVLEHLLQQPDNTTVAMLRYRHKNGSWVWLEGVGRNLLHDLSIGAIVANFRNISERKQQEEALRRRAEELTALHDITLDVIGLYDLPQLLQLIVERAARLLDSSSGALYLADSQRQEVRCVVAHNTAPDHVGVILHYSQGAAGIVAQTGRPLNIDNYRAWPGRVSQFQEAATFVAVLTVPMIWQGEIIGVVQVLDSAEDRRFTESNLELLTLCASQAALAVQNTRLLETEREQRALAEALREAGTILSETLDFDAVLDRLLDQIERVVPYDAANVALVESGYTRVVRMRGYERIGLKMAQGVANLRLEIATTPNLRQMAATGRPLVIPNTRTNPDWVRIEALADSSSWAGAPVKVQDQVIAFFSLDKIEPDFYQPADAVRLAAFAGQAALALQNARFFAEAERRARELDLLNRVIAAAASAQDEIEVLQTGCTELARFFNVPQAALALLDESQTHETVVAEYLAPGRPSALGVRIPIKDNPAMQAILTAGQPVAVLDAASHPTTAPIEEVMRERGSVSLLIVPITVRGQVVGTLGIDSLVRREFTAEEIRLAKTVGEELGRALETARLYERLRTYAAELEGRVSRRTRELAEANERLQELDRLKSKFVSDVSHELRTPITNLSLYLDLMHRGKPEKRESYLAIINEQTARLGRLIEDILNLSRLELGQDKIAFEASDLNALIAQIMAAHQLRAEVAGLQLRFTPDISLPPATIAPNQLNLALSNLIANAINYTESGFIHVLTHYLSGSNELYIRVQDTGMGIDEEDMAHLFERFYRGHHISQSTIPGTGLGLAIVHEVVELHNGRIEVESRAGHGSTFHIWLPLQR
jgi:PAS domain S-box-containing protein